MIENELFIKKFCELFLQPDVEKVISLTSPDIVYNNIPLGPAYGHEGVRKFLGPCMHPARCSKIDFHNSASKDDFVMNHRTETWEYGDVIVTLPVAGFFRIADKKIIEWTDYFDGATMEPLGIALMKNGINLF